MTTLTDNTPAAPPQPPATAPQMLLTPPAERPEAPILIARPDVSIAHLDFVDTLRGIAILGVILFHCAHSAGELPRAVSAVTSRGAMGVPLFYLASAFTLFLSMAQRRSRDPKPTLAFFVRRFFRIAPLFYLVIPLYFAINGFRPQYLAPYGTHGWQIALSYLFANGWHPESINAAVPGGWSIAVEMTFYLLLPLLFAYITNLPRALLLVAACFALRFSLDALFGPMYHAMYPPDTRYIADIFMDSWLPAQLPVFAIGIVFYFLFKRLRPQHRRPRWGYLCLLACALSIPLALLEGRVAAGLPLFLFALALALHPTRLLVNAFTRYVGKISYGLYLLNYAAIHVALKLLNFLHAPTRPVVRLGLLTATTLAIAVVLATLTFYAIEEPGRKLGKWLLEKLQASRPPVRIPASQIA